MWFIINSEKSVWEPQKELMWLGIKINLINSCFTIAENRILSIMKSIQVAIKNLQYTTAREHGSTSRTREPGSTSRELSFSLFPSCLLK